MIFSSNAFIFAFLPIALIGYYAVGRLGVAAANGWLITASLAFYAYWNPWFLLILIASVTFNYVVGHQLHAIDPPRKRLRMMLLWFGIIGNLLLLGYFKYFFPLLGFAASFGLVPQSWITTVVLPLGISFFTFTQIGYLLDTYGGHAKERGIIPYAVFVTLFPHLLAGPILHNSEILPQVTDPTTKKFKAENMAVGLAMFTMGMAKKVLLADPLSYLVEPGFAHVHDLSTGTAWITALAYSLQIYFDFSGYSDMAVGLARMFGIIFPANFNSPYKATSIIEFWSRWHMTLTRYLTLYLYNPVALGITRRRVARGKSTAREATRTAPAFLSLVAFPTFYTMGIAGVWHGAGLQFIIFGLLHAAYLSINRAWRMFGPQNLHPSTLRTLAYGFLTFLGVLIAEIFFRAATASDAVVVVHAMFSASDKPFTSPGATKLARIFLEFGICIVLPNTQQILREFKPVLQKVSPPSGLSLTWRPNLLWGMLMGFILLASLLRMSDVSKFLYFQF